MYLRSSKKIHWTRCPEVPHYNASRCALNASGRRSLGKGASTSLRVTSALAKLRVAAAAAGDPNGNLWALRREAAAGRHGCPRSAAVANKELCASVVSPAPREDGAAEFCLCIGLRRPPLLLALALFQFTPFIFPNLSSVALGKCRLLCSMSATHSLLCLSCKQRSTTCSPCQGLYRRKAQVHLSLQ